MRKTTRWLLVAGAAVGLTAAARSTGSVGRTLRHGAQRVAKRVRYARGRLRGARYALAGRTPDPDVTDDVLAQRIRSMIGPLEHRIDMPRVHVDVEEHVVRLAGEVPSKADAVSIERTVAAVSGVRGVESYLHVGLRPGSARPGDGRATAAAAPSSALRRLLGAASDAGIAGGQERDAVRAVLSMFADRLPENERSQLFGHVPADVRELAAVPARFGARAPRLRTVRELVGSIAVEGGMDAPHAARVTEGVIGCLRQLVPEEAADVDAVLPADLAALWMSAVPG